MKKFLPWIILLFVAAGGFAAWQLFLQPETAVADASLIPLLAEEADGFAQATIPNNIEFPRDLGPHDDYQTEWWYYTGNLQTAEGREFGYQLTFFRRALTPPGERPLADSEWRTNQIYLAHFTISDIQEGGFYPHERFSRGAAGLAGAQADPYRVWLEDWYAEEIAPGVVRLFASSDDVTLDIELRQSMDPVLHGDGGLSPKGPEPGNASYYYSLIQQPSRGTVRIGEETFEVTGRSWKDHEYSTSALSGNAIGWDWFSIQLDDGSALMFFEIRNSDGGLEPFSSGTFITADGQVNPLKLGDWTLTVMDTWDSPDSQATYPVAWEITVPEFGIELSGAALMPNQELNVSTIYWEGAVAYTGTVNGRSVTARGYVEMTGYGESMEGRI